MTTAGPLAFLVSTTADARAIRGSLGAPAYSYYFVVEALAPVLGRLGTWRLIDRPESRLAFAAARAESEGFVPVHLAIRPPQEAYLTPGIPTIVWPFWEFPDIPDRDFGHDTRQNWARTLRRVDLLIAACQFTADALRRPDVGRPVAVVPVPLPTGAFQLPDWDPGHSWTFTCRHEVLGPSSAGPTIIEDGRGEAVAGSRSWRLARAGFRKVYPRLSPETVARITRLKVGLQDVRERARGRSPAKLAYLGLRGVYRRTVRRWLNEEALARITSSKDAALALLGRAPTVVIDPLLPSTPLTLGGLVYTSILNLGDRRKNVEDLLSAFLLAFRERPDVTLVLKLATSPHREHHEAGVLRRRYEALGLEHACRVVVITEYLDDHQMNDLMRATTFYVNASRAEGACLPLQRALAGGRPALAPTHTAMADYMDDRVGFVLRSQAEPTDWPHDPDGHLETYRYRLVWSDLRDQFRASAEVAEHDPAGYRARAEAARRRMADYAGLDAAEDALRRALAMLPEGRRGARAWAS